MWSYPKHGGTRSTKHSRCNGAVSIPYSLPSGQQEPRSTCHGVTKSARAGKIRYHPLNPLLQCGADWSGKGVAHQTGLSSLLREFFFLFKPKSEFLFENEFLDSGFSQTFPQGTIELQYISNLKFRIVDEVLKITRLGNPNICYFSIFSPSTCSRIVALVLECGHCL